MDSRLAFLAANGYLEAHVPPGFAVAAKVEAVAGEQESLLRRVGMSREEILSLLDGLHPLGAEPDQAGFDSSSTHVRTALLGIDDEIRAVGGARIQIVESHLRTLLGEHSLGVTLLTPELVRGELGALRDYLGLTGDDVDTVDDERVRTSFWSLTELVADLRSAWDSHRSAIPDASSVNVTVQPVVRGPSHADVGHGQAYLRLNYEAALVGDPNSDDVDHGSETGDKNGSLGDCRVFPADNPWNTDISAFPLHPNSDKYIAHILSSGKKQHLQVDFSIPYVTVGDAQPAVPVRFDDPEQSDPGPYPLPPQVPVDASDGHVIVVDRDNSVLYELYNASRSDKGWTASNGARWDLTSNELRPIGWPSADAAGLPIFAGLIRYDEVASGHIDHALRGVFSASATQKGFVLPATRYAPGGSADPDSLPMGLRLRLRADYDVSSFPAPSRVILEALKKYGLIVADNGQNWFLTAADDARWRGDEAAPLQDVPGSAFEVVHTGPVRMT